MQVQDSASPRLPAQPPVAPGAPIPPTNGCWGPQLSGLGNGCTPGFTVGRDQPMMGIRGTSHLELHFDDVELTNENLLGEEGGGLKLALSVLGRVRLAQVAARSIGKATKVLCEMAGAERVVGVDLGQAALEACRQVCGARFEHVDVVGCSEAETAERLAALRVRLSLRACSSNHSRSLARRARRHRRRAGVRLRHRHYDRG